MSWCPPSIHDVPEPLLAALRERAARHGRSLPQELRDILEAAVVAPPAEQEAEPVRLQTVRTTGTFTWPRQDIYRDASP